MNTSLLLQALHGKNKRVPVWFMRQAGRYLPAYQDLRRKYSLKEMFKNPELVSQVTCLPVGLLNVDAAILFADILTLPSRMGFDIDFDHPQGPWIKNPISSVSDLKNLHPFAGAEHLQKAIPWILGRLPRDVPLIGFAGAPFTVACYLMEGGSSTNFRKTFQFAYSQPKAFAQLLSLLTRSTIRYLTLQKRAGIQIFQLFDTWGGILRGEEYKKWSLPWVQAIFKNVDLPSIYYLKNCSHLLPLMERCGADILSVCHTVELGRNPVLNKTKKGIQGNLFNGYLYADYPVLESEVKRVLTAARGYKKYIFNLSHGVFPDTNMGKLRYIVELVHNFRWDE